MSKQTPSKSYFGARELKVVLIGDASVGKTSLLNRYITGSHSVAIQPTLGAAFTTKLVDSDGEAVKLQIWDTSGEERYRSMAPLYYRGASVVLVLFDLTVAESFNDVQVWLAQLREHVPEASSLVLLIGNKSDLVVQGQRKVDEAKARAYADSIKAEYFEASAVTGENVEKVFARVAAFNPAAGNHKSVVSKGLSPATPPPEKKCCK